MLLLLFFCFLYVSSYDVYAVYKDEKCSEYSITVLGQTTTKKIGDDGVYKGDKCYKDTSTKVKCEGGDPWELQNGGAECKGDKWETVNVTSKDGGVCPCDGSCCEVKDNGMYKAMKCYCGAYKTLDVIWLITVISIVVPCCWIGCTCILFFVALIMCCACNCGGNCFGNL